MEDSNPLKSTWLVCLGWRATYLVLQVLGWGTKNAHCFSSIDSALSSLPTDLENFKTQRRSPVRVREGQGVVLLCGPPLYSGGKASPRACPSLR